MTRKTLVEVSVTQPDGSATPYGIMNTDQAAELCDDTFHKAVVHEPSVENADVSDDPLMS
jgi:hypothetical protein